MILKDKPSIRVILLGTFGAGLCCVQNLFQLFHIEGGLNCWDHCTISKDFQAQIFPLGPGLGHLNGSVSGIQGRLVLDSFSPIQGRDLVGIGRA